MLSAHAFMAREQAHREHGHEPAAHLRHDRLEDVVGDPNSKCA